MNTLLCAALTAVWGILRPYTKDQRMLVSQFARTYTTVLTLAGLACAGMPAHSQTAADRISNLERRLEQSNQLIQQLQARIEQLERTAGARQQNDETAVAAAQTAGPHPTEMPPELPPTASGTEGVPLHAFADVGYVQSTRANEVGRKGGRQRPSWISSCAERTPRSTAARTAAAIALLEPNREHCLEAI